MHKQHNTDTIQKVVTNTNTTLTPEWKVEPKQKAVTNQTE